MSSFDDWLLVWSEVFSGGLFSVPEMLSWPCLYMVRGNKWIASGKTFLGEGGGVTSSTSNWVIFEISVSSCVVGMVAMSCVVVRGEFVETRTGLSSGSISGMV